MENILYKKNIPILKFSEENGYIEVLQVYNKVHLPVHLYTEKIFTETKFSIIKHFLGI